jgi:hypothetical protein
MWNYDSELNRWSQTDNVVTFETFEFLKQELSSYRFYSKCLSGATYFTTKSIDDIYNVLGAFKPKNWYLNSNYYKYSNSPIPVEYASPINEESYYDYYKKYLSEYGLTLKNLFTPDRLIKDQIKNFIYVDVATTEQLLDLNSIVNNRVIDGVRLKDGHKVLVKDQQRTEVIPYVDFAGVSASKGPDEYFKGNYYFNQTTGATSEYRYFTSENGIYTYTNGNLVKDNQFDEYEKCIRLSVVVKEGLINREKQFHLSRLLNGYYPRVGDGPLLELGNFINLDEEDPVEFVDGKNWILRNKVEYNNLFEVNYYDVAKFSTQSYFFEGFEYIIPERTISVGEFGSILNHQTGRSNFIDNKYKVNLRGLSSTTVYYWVCGDNGILLKIRKHDFLIENIKISSTNNFRSVSFYDDLKGVVVGDLNTVFVTSDGGFNWKKITVDAFKSYYYNKVVYYSPTDFFIGGNVGIFIEFKNNIYGWTAYKRRISRLIDDDDEYLLVDNINDLFYTTINTWGLSYSYSTQSIDVNKKMLFITTDDSKIIAHDVSNSTKFSFIYLDFEKNYGDIKSISRRKNTNQFYFTGMDELTGNTGLFSFDLSNFQYLGVNNSFSNTTLSTLEPIFESENYANKIFDYNSQDLLLCGNDALLVSSTYINALNFNVLDPDFSSTLKSKMLFLDYDVSSKLNFFRDNGDYRLPNDVEFSFNPTYSTYLNFDSLLIPPKAPSYLTQSEVNWFKYWQDKQMTFKYIATASELTNATKVLISSEFSYSTFSVVNFTASTITKNITDIITLAPTISDKGHSRFSALGYSITQPINSYDLYLYEYLGVLCTEQYFKVSPGDVIRFESNILNSDFIVNRIEDISQKRYIYFFTEFNQNIINELDQLGSVKITNLNKYEDINDFYNKFNSHPISNGYSLEFYNDYELNQISLDFELGFSTSSYTNWVISSGFTTSASFSNSFMTNNFGESYIESPEIYNVDRITFDYTSTIGQYNFASQSTISVLGWNGSIWDNLQTFSMSDGIAGSIYNTANILLTSSYSKFKFNFDTASASNNFSHPYNYKPIIIDNILLYSNTFIDVDSNTYGTVSNYTNFIKIKPKFNNFTSYYNLATKVINQSSTYEMVYTGAFLKFGYTPEYNLLDYLESINDVNDPDPPFYAEKEYLCMPDFRQIPMPGVGGLINGQVYVDFNGISYSNSFLSPGNKILFSSQLEKEWQSIFKNTYLDINLHSSSIYSTSFTASSVRRSEKMLVTEKYYDADNNVYVIELHKSLNFDLGVPLYWIDIISRRKLKQISDDLGQLNNIKEPIKNISYTSGNTYSTWNVNFETYGRETNYKINTDSYAKILLSDADTVQSISSIIYTDYKNELAMNVTKIGLPKIIELVPILNTANFIVGSSSYLFINCSQKHGLKTGEGAVFEFTGGTYSSQYLNRQYTGYHPVVVVSEYSLYLNMPYGTPPLVGNDTGTIQYTKRDPFFNYSPVDLIDVGVNKKAKVSIELNVDNLVVKKDTFRLSNVDFNKYRFRLVDRLDIEELSAKYPWIFEAEISGAVIGEYYDDILGTGDLVWYKGTWQCGRWFGGYWQSGDWISGDWYDGFWSLKPPVKPSFFDNFSNVKGIDEFREDSEEIKSTWYGGRWYNGTWNDGTWVNGRWYGGTWSNGVWYKGIWNDGTWNSGLFTGGVWVRGTWNGGTFNTDNEPAYWLDGNWFGGDFENGMWYNGLFDQKNGESRFGTKAYNSRTATWHGGKWKSGSFHSKLNINDSGQYDVSDVHKYSMWYTGQWFGGDFYGGIAYNIDFRSGTWHGGILEDIQVIGFTGSTLSSENYLTLNGIFKFNIGDEVTIIDNQLNGPYSQDFGSNQLPKNYIILNTIEGTYSYLGETRKKTDVYVNKAINYSVTNPTDLGLRVVSVYHSCNWKTGIWTNGIYKTGLWEGGIWYNGIFEENAIWM